MAEQCDGLGGDFRLRQSLCSDNALELVANTALAGAPFPSDLQGSGRRHAQKAVLPPLSPHNALQLFLQATLVDH